VNLPPGATLRNLRANPDRRGWLMEAFRAEWTSGLAGAQVNVTWSRAGSLRGSHVHHRHADYFVLAQGRSIIGLKDLRRRSAAFGSVHLIELHAESPRALAVPPGVLHGLYFPVDSLLVTVESHAYDPDEELRCRWDDPELGIPWPFRDAILSDADRDAQSFAELMRAIEPWQERFRL
jgi:dTDP-4-dehydrorhamnose 3,5-epimerase